METMKRGSMNNALMILGMTIAILLVAGCSTLNTALGAMGGEKAPEKTESKQAENPPASDQKQANAASAMAHQYQFGAFYSGFWNMGWFGYKDASYKPGQGTMWKFTNTGSSKEPVSIERALLKVLPDKSQWWRFKMASGKTNIIYEFLAGPDSLVTKVRYQDPDTGEIGEFVPNQKQMEPQAGTGASSAPKSRAEMSKYYTGKQSVKVAAGTFMADHYLYAEESGNGTAESWVNEKVPGSMVKTIYTSKKNNQISSGELIQIESGVTTALKSY